MIATESRRERSAYLYAILLYSAGGTLSILISVVFHFNKELMGLVFLMASFLALILFRGVGIPASDAAYPDARRRRLSPFVGLASIIWIACLSLSIYLFAVSRTNYYLPYEYFLAIGIAAASISAQLFLTDRLSPLEERFVLLEILSVSIMLSLSFLLLFPGPYGNDARYHAEYVDHILSSGHLGGDIGRYHNYPVYHLLLVSFMSVLGDGIRTAGIAVAAAQVFFGLFVFVLARRLFDTRIALLAILLCSMAPYLLTPRYSLFPGSFAAIFFMLVLFVQFAWFDQRSARLTGLLVFAFAVVVLSHPFAPIALGVSLLSMTVARWAMRLTETRIPTRAHLFLLMMALLWWMTPWEDEHNLLSHLVSTFQDALRSFGPGAVEQATLAPSLPWIDIFLSDLGFSLLILFGLIGSFYLLRSTRTIVGIDLRGIGAGKLILAATVLALVPVPFLLTLVVPQSLPARWFPFLEVVLSITAAVGLVALFSEYGAPRTRRSLTRLLGVSIVLVIVLMMTTSPVTNPNSHLYSTKLATRSSLTDSEIQIAFFINNLEAPEVSANSKFIYLDITSTIDPNDISTYSDGLVVVREYDFEKGFTIPMFGSEGKLLEIVYPGDEFMTFLSESDRICDIGETKVYDAK